MTLVMLTGDSRKTASSVAARVGIEEVVAFAYNVLAIPVAAGVLYPFFGILLSPVVAAAAMSMSSVTVVSNALRLRKRRVED